VEEAISPYSRFVRTEKERFSKATNELQDSREKLAVLRAELE
jgi:hypothetical protein